MGLSSWVHPKYCLLVGHHMGGFAPSLIKCYEATKEMKVHWICKQVCSKEGTMDLPVWKALWEIGPCIWTTPYIYICEYFS